MKRSPVLWACAWVLTACNCSDRVMRTVPGEEEAASYHFQGLDSLQREALASHAAAQNRPITAVALSGGAQNGAFGAGIVCNWRDRPAHVDMWTGISTGALLFTHAFLIGPEITFPAADLPGEKERYRRELEEAYTTYGESDLMKKRGLLKMLSSSGMASMEGLRAIVGKYVTNQAIDRLSAAARETDVLVVGTTDLDTGRFVAWDMKLLARDKRYDLYRKIVFTSCLEPGAMDPEYVAGHMHADGGVRYQIFAPLLQSEVAGSAKTQAARTRSRTLEVPPGAPAAAVPPLVCVYLLVNGRLEEQAVLTGTCLIDIGLRAIDLIALESKLGNLLRIQALMEDLAFMVTGDPRSRQFVTLLAAIDPSFDDMPTSHFDPIYMRQLFDHGEQRVLGGTAWRPFRVSGKSVVFTSEESRP